MRADSRYALRGDILDGIASCLCGTFDYDPGYGLTVLAEIARRALSSAVNDPGTAVDVIISQTRLLGDWARWPYGEQAESQFTCISVEPLAPAELIAEAFGSISRDTGASLDVTLAMLRGLKTRAKAAPSDLRKPAMQLAQEILARAEFSMKFPQDIAAVRAAVDELATPKATS